MKRRDDHSGAGGLRPIPLVVRWASEGRADGTAFLNRWPEEAPANWNDEFLQEWLRKERARG